MPNGNDPKGRGTIGKLFSNIAAPGAEVEDPLGLIPTDEEDLFFQQQDQVINQRIMEGDIAMAEAFAAATDTAADVTAAPVGTGPPEMRASTPQTQALPDMTVDRAWKPDADDLLLLLPRASVEIGNKAIEFSHDMLSFAVEHLDDVPIVRSQKFHDWWYANDPYRIPRTYGTPDTRGGQLAQDLSEFAIGLSFIGGPAIKATTGVASTIGSAVGRLGRIGAKMRRVVETATKMGAAGGATDMVFMAGMDDDDLHFIGNTFESLGNNMDLEWLQDFGFFLSQEAERPDQVMMERLTRGLEGFVTFAMADVFLRQMWALWKASGGSIFYKLAGRQGTQHANRYAADALMDEQHQLWAIGRAARGETTPAVRIAQQPNGQWRVGGRGGPTFSTRAMAEAYTAPYTGTAAVDPAKGLYTHDQINRIRVLGRNLEQVRMHEYRNVIYQHDLGLPPFSNVAEGRKYIEGLAEHLPSFWGVTGERAPALLLGCDG
jgi:hypothetical protein